MLFSCAEPGKNFHHIAYFFFLFGARLIESVLFLEVEQLTTNDKLLPANAFGEFVVVDVDESELHFLLLLAVVVVEFHLGQQQLSVVVVLHLEVSPFRHVTHYLSRI